MGAASDGAEALKSQLLANLSHELRTPLHVILGYVEILGEEHLTDTSGYETLGRFGATPRRCSVSSRIPCGIASLPSYSSLPGACSTARLSRQEGAKVG